MDALPYSGAVTCKWVRENDIGETSPPNIMRAKKKPIVTTTPDALGVDVA
jgi:electron transfer flavoprotein alpha/beta subunit